MNTHFAEHSIKCKSNQFPRTLRCLLMNKITQVELNCTVLNHLQYYTSGFDRRMFTHKHIRIDSMELQRIYSLTLYMYLLIKTVKSVERNVTLFSHLHNCNSFIELCVDFNITPHCITYIELTVVY